jgi:hypothetical protein
MAFAACDPGGGRSARGQSGGRRQLDNAAIDEPLAVPEPADASLMLAGIAALGWRARRKR